MKAITVDDEIYMLENLQEAVSASSDIDAVAAFSSCSAALTYATENPVDVAFLDINMRGIGGLGLAEKLLELQPRCKIIFCTGYQEYAVSAFQLHVSGYLMKPITAEAVQKEIDHIKGVKATEKLLTINCFGNFEVLHNGESLPFKRKKAKELLAVLIRSYETPTHFCVEVKDDGVGFDTSLPIDEKKHVGLRNIRGRLKAMVGGDLILESTPDVGTKAVIMIPKEVTP